MIDTLRAGVQRRWRRPPRSTGLTVRQERALRNSRRLAHFMDARWGAGRLRFGVETVAGLVPVFGDAASAAASLYQLGAARRLGVSRHDRMDMIRNVVVDFALGLVPFLGDAADTFYKAHLRNQKIIERHVARMDGVHSRPGSW
jgi:hypothetical protein